MPRRDGPSTMGSPFYGPGCIRSAKKMNNEARDNKAERVLIQYLKENPSDTEKTFELLKANNGSFHATALALELIDEPVVAGKRQWY